MFGSLETLRCLVFLAVILGLGGVLGGDKQAARCGRCDPQQCQPVADDCPEAFLVLDSCKCCNVCKTEQHPAKLSKVTRDAECSKVQCPRGQVCVLNIQDLPVCRCPSKLACPRRQRKLLCGKNGVTYKSRCLLKVDECSTGKKIRIAHRGPCPGYDKLAEETRLARRAERLARREERKLRQKGKGKGKRRKARFYRGRY